MRIHATRQANGSRRAICQGDESGEKLQRLDIRCLLALRPNSGQPRLSQNGSTHLRAPHFPLKGVELRAFMSR